MEFNVSLKVIQDFLPNLRAKILSCGAGSRRYAIKLASLGYPVTLLDSSEQALRTAEREAELRGIAFQETIQGEPIDLEQFPQDSLDALLLFEPLSQMPDEEAGLSAIAEARRVLRSGGVLYATLNSWDAVQRWTTQYEQEELLPSAGVNEESLETELLKTGENLVDNIPAFLARQQEDIDRFWEAGMEVEGVFGLQGLVVAMKPVWQSVLKTITSRLNNEGLKYKIVGGASIALQGVPVKVNDLDLEMEKDAVYRFQELFPEQMRQRVRFCEDEFYCSYLGNFDFNDVAVEVIGELKRKEEGGWVNTSTKTSREVSLDGLPVCVSWLEEETLAYIRRDRMTRAVLCLEKCDQKRLLALLRGEVEIGVL